MSGHEAGGGNLTALHLGPAPLMAAMAVLAAGSAAQAVTGFGLSLVAVPILVLLVGPVPAVRLIDEVALGLNLLLLARDHRTVQPTTALRLLVPALVVAPLAAYAVHRSNPGALSVTIGGVIVACGLILWSGRRAVSLRGRSGMAVAGALSAAMNTTSGVGGPVVAMYALNADWPVEMATPTLQIYFFGLNLLSLLALGPVSLSIGPAAGLVGAILVGGFLGTVLARRLDAALITRAVLVLAVGGGIAAVIRGLVQIAT